MVAASSPALALLLAASFASPALTVPSNSVHADPFAVAEQVLQSRLAAGNGPVEGLQQQLRNLAAARTLVGILDRPTETPLRQTIDLALAASQFQVETLGTVPHPVAVAHFDGPVPPLRELAARHGAAIGAGQEAALQALDALPTEARTALTAFLAAFLALEDTSRAAFAGYTPPAVDFAARGFAEPLPFDGIHLGFDAASILAARSAFLATIPPLAEAIPRLTAPQSHSATLSLQPAFSIDLATDSDTFAANEPFVLVLDSGGDDTYNNNAGGNNIGGTCVVGSLVPAAALVDLGAGMDTYGNAVSPGFCGATGGGFEGAGLLVDGGGDDHYVADFEGANGGGYTGVGLLIDSDGADRYDAGRFGGLNGGSFLGVGALVDRSGADRYTVASSLPCGTVCGGFLGGVGTNGGADTGLALLLDGAGADAYLAGVGVTCTVDCSAGSGAVNGGSTGDHGAGFLLDAGAEGDTYQAGVGVTCTASNSGCSAGDSGTNGGAAISSTATLVDLGGNDLYEVGVDDTLSCSLAGGSLTGYACTAGSLATQGGAVAGGVGLLLDAFGNDTYSAGTGSSVSCTGSVSGTSLVGAFDVGSVGVNGGAYLGAGLLIDGTGVDAYAVGTGSTLSCPTLSVVFSGATLIGFPDGVGKFGVNGGVGNLLLAANPESDWWPGVGLLWDAGSFGDTYSDNEGGTGTDLTVVPKGILGAQLDCEGALPPSCL